MTENSATIEHDQEPLRRDDEGNPVYGAWDEDGDVEAEIVEDEDDSSDDWIVEHDPPSEATYYHSADVRDFLQYSWDDFRRKVLAKKFDDEALLDGVEKMYSTSQAAQFFGRSNQWLYWGLREGIFVYKDGTPILPERAGKNGRRRFTLPLIREIALSCYRRGQIQEDELHDVMAKILLAEFGPKAFADTESDTA